MDVSINFGTFSTLPNTAGQVFVRVMSAAMVSAISGCSSSGDIEHRMQLEYHLWLLPIITWCYNQPDKQ
jgi:hypothetical protein